VGIATYRFVDRLEVAGRVEGVYELLSRPCDYPAWWGDVFLSAEGDTGPPEPGKKSRVVTRGWLPYRLRWQLECLAVEENVVLASRITGDFEGTGTWVFEQDGAVARATLTWDVRVTKPLVRTLSPLLRPVFAWNHGWAMRRGQRHLEEIVGPRSDVSQQAVEAGP
jgi:hypothetical protein